MNGLDYRDLVALAEASYVYLDRLSQIGRDYSNPLHLFDAITDDTIEGEFSPSQANDFITSWSVAEHRPNTESGFSSTLFKNVATGEYVLSFRGTETSLPGAIADADADLNDLVQDGIAIGQVIDMYNEYQRLSSPAGQPYQVATLKRLDAETEQYRLRYMSTIGKKGSVPLLSHLGGPQG